jgi:hypothetical protein
MPHNLASDGPVGAHTSGNEIQKEFKAWVKINEKVLSGF